MIDLLRAAAKHGLNRQAVVTSGRTSTFGQILESAECAAANLGRLKVDRVAILDSDPHHVIPLLAGSALAGVEACIYPVAASDEAVGEYRERFDHQFIASSRPTLVAAGATSSDSLLRDEGAPRQKQAPSGVPLLIMTTGTTSGKPRAARHEWDKILRPSRNIRPTPEQRWLLSYGLNQFGGLQILIHFLGAQATLIAGETFQPRDGLTAMRQWNVTHASGTPTFWRFLLAELRNDGGAVPALEQITMSGEAIPAALLSEVRATFPHARLSQIYAATEFGQAVTVRDGIAGLPTNMLNSGNELDFRVVNGELWVKSSAAMLGYYDEPTLDPGEWRATGDLVEIVGDRVEFRGRKSDVINVGGVKIHPLPIEDRISQLPGVALARVFGKSSALVGSIVAVDIVPAPGHESDEIESQIRRVCADLPPAARPRSIRFVESIDLIGNKLSRSGSK